MTAGGNSLGRAWAFSICGSGLAVRMPSFRAGCAKRAGCQMQTDSTLPVLACLLQPQPKSEQLAACHVDGSRVEGFFAGPDSLWPVFLGTFRRVNGKT